MFQYMFRDYDSFFGCDYLVMLDADVFLSRPFTVDSYLSSANATAAAVQQSRHYKSAGLQVTVNYIWNALTVYNMKTLPGRFDINWDYGQPRNEHLISSKMKSLTLDTGGHNHHWLDKHNPAMRDIRVTTLPENGEVFAETFRKFEALKLGSGSVIEVFDGYFVHTHNGCNWKHEPGNAKIYNDNRLQIIEDHLQRSSQLYKKGGA